MFLNLGSLFRGLLAEVVTLQFFEKCSIDKDITLSI